MSSILFFTKAAESLNREIQTLDPCFFLLVNYNPATGLVGEEATFTRAALNLYRFLKDAGIISQLPGILRGTAPGIGPALDTIESVTADADILRTYLGHNQDPASGTDDTIRQAANWMDAAIGKPRLVTPDDHRRAAEQVEAEARAAYDSVRTVIAALRPFKTSDAAAWRAIWQRCADKMCGYYRNTIVGKIIVYHQIQGMYADRYGDAAADEWQDAAACARALAENWKDWRLYQNKPPLDKSCNKNKPGIVLYLQDLVCRMKRDAQNGGQKKIQTFLPQGMERLISKDLKLFHTRLPNAPRHF